MEEKEVKVDDGAGTQEPEKKYFKMNDDLIGMIRELVQLALLTGTNIVDHLRAIVIEVAPHDKRFVTVAPEYVEAYNKMVEDLNRQAEEKYAEMQKEAEEGYLVLEAPSVNGDDDPGAAN